VVGFKPCPLYHQEKSHWYPLDRRLGGSQSQSRGGGEEKYSKPLPGIEPEERKYEVDSKEKGIKS
jgi:hypothetical protein